MAAVIFYPRTRRFSIHQRAANPIFPLLVANKRIKIFKTNTDRAPMLEDCSHARQT
jgi:hypothetical protein